jgi:tetratricopeptide (TPR) repeat protein
MSHHIKDEVAMIRLFLACLTVLLLAACKHFPVRQTVGQKAPLPVQIAQVRPVASPAVEDTPEVQAPKQVLPDVELTDDLLYQILLADIASQRGDATLAAKIGTSVAQQTRDPRLAARAVQMTLDTGQVDKTIASIKLWREVETNSLAPSHMLAAMLLRAGRLDDAHAEFVDLLQRDPVNAGTSFLQAYQMLLAMPDKSAALDWMRDLVKAAPKVAEGHWAVAQLAHAGNDDTLALTEARMASQLRPEWSDAVALEAALLQKSAPQSAIDKLQTYLLTHPHAQEIRLQYARALLEQKQFSPSREEFRKLAEENPETGEWTFAVAMISFQLQDYQDAQQQLERLLDKGTRNQDAVLYYLGQASEARQDTASAIAYYDRVDSGEYHFSAQLRAAYLVNKRGEMASAIERLHTIKAEDNQQRAQLTVTEARFLSNADRPAEAYALLQHGLEKLPNHPDLIYETAMAAEKTGKPDVTEKLLRKLIQMQPNDPQAYNALGFSLLERNERIPEAMSLVEKALQLAPDDAAIIDSVGWGYYRSGKLDKSIEMLRRAYAGNPDPEIAAHLGEVLWVHGQRDEAKQIWQDSLKRHASNTQLQAVIRKFDP